MKTLCLFSKDIPLVEFTLKPGGRGIALRRVFEEHGALMPLSSRDGRQTAFFHAGCGTAFRLPAIGFCGR